MPTSPASAGQTFASALLFSVAIPLFATIVMGLVRTLFRDQLDNTQQIKFDLSWDFCVLGLGLIGGIVVTPRLREDWSVEALFALMAIMMLMDIGFGVLILRFGDKRQRESLCLTFGCLAVGLPTVLLFT